MGRTATSGQSFWIERARCSPAKNWKRHRPQRSREWIISWGWDETMPADEQPTADWLDAVVPHHPVMLSRMDMHTWWVNSHVLEAAGITAETADPPNSHIGRDESGRPNGLLSEWNALALINYIPNPARTPYRRGCRMLSWRLTRWG
ncbi:MAG: amidohydrolase family protein [Chloroflexota bacterium]